MTNNMKYIILILDGAADYPLNELDGKTPLQTAYKQNVDNMAKNGKCGLLETIPANFPAGSTVANLSILGYDPLKYFHGRGVLEAASLGIQLEKNDVAFRCNTICIENNKIKNHSANHISSEEASELIKAINNVLATDEIKFYPGISYRHLLVLKNNYSPEVECIPPHDHLNEPVNNLLVKAKTKKGEKTAVLLNKLILNSKEILKKHPVNAKRKEQGKDPANLIWPWSPGKTPDMKTFQERFNIKGAVISAVSLIKGLGIYCGFDVKNVDGATGLSDTNYEGKAEACVNALKNYDLVYVHVEATDEAGHEGNLKLKIKCIEDFDKRLVGNIINKISLNNTTIAVLPDHPTPVKTKSHTSDPVPFLIYKPGEKADSVIKLDEESCKNGGYGLLKGENFIQEFLSK